MAQFTHVEKLADIQKAQTDLVSWQRTVAGQGMIGKQITATADNGGGEVTGVVVGLKLTDTGPRLMLANGTTVGVDQVTAVETPATRRAARQRTARRRPVPRPARRDRAAPAPARARPVPARRHGHDRNHRHAWRPARQAARLPAARLPAARLQAVRRPPARPQARRPRAEPPPRPEESPGRSPPVADPRTRSCLYELTLRNRQDGGQLSPRKVQTGGHRCPRRTERHDAVDVRRGFRPARAPDDDGRRRRQHRQRQHGGLQGQPRRLREHPVAASARRQPAGRSRRGRPQPARRRHQPDADRPRRPRGLDRHERHPGRPPDHGPQLGHRHLRRRLPGRPQRRRHALHPGRQPRLRRPRQPHRLDRHDRAGVEGDGLPRHGQHQQRDQRHQHPAQRPPTTRGHQHRLHGRQPVRRCRGGRRATCRHHHRLRPERHPAHDAGRWRARRRQRLDRHRQRGGTTLGTST